MAIATLERCYNNPAVFTGVVKIRKGEAVKLMMETTDIESVKAIMYTYMTKVCSLCPHSNLEFLMHLISTETSLCPHV